MTKSAKSKKLLVKGDGAVGTSGAESGEGKLVDGKFPTVIELFSRKYTIEYLDDLTHIDERSKECLLGYVDFIAGKIKIFYKKGTTDDVSVWQTIFHEIFHIIKKDLNVELREDKEESVVDNFALGITHFLINNKLM